MAEPWAKYFPSRGDGILGICTQACRLIVGGVFSGIDSEVEWGIRRDKKGSVFFHNACPKRCRMNKPPRPRSKRFSGSWMV
jgi:hypothetical protein